jgi:hypothetical protein
MMRERDVVAVTRTHLRTSGLAGHRVMDLYTDAHYDLLADSMLAPFQRFTLALDGFSVHSDLVGRLADGETTFAIEAKGEDDLLHGLGQALTYRFGFHRVLLAVAGEPPGDLITLARQQQVGLIAAFADRAQVLELPPAHLPLHAHAAAISSSLPPRAHSRPLYLQPADPLPQRRGSAPRDRRYDCAGARGAAYPVLPRGWPSFQGVLRGAQHLGLVAVRGPQISPTAISEAAGRLLPDLAELAALDTAAARPPRQATLAALHPQTGAVLRWLLAPDPVASLLREALADLGGGPVTMPTLPQAALARDYAQALAICVVPEVVAAITDHRGRLRWDAVQPRHYRSTTFFQYKSILRHAGVIAPHPLGASSAATYDPDADRWELLRGSAWSD